MKLRLLPLLSSFLLILLLQVGCDETTSGSSTPDGGSAPGGNEPPGENKITKAKAAAVSAKDALKLAESARKDAEKARDEAKGFAEEVSKKKTEFDALDGTDTNARKKASDEANAIASKAKKAAKDAVDAASRSAAAVAVAKEAIAASALHAESAKAVKEAVAKAEVEAKKADEAKVAAEKSAGDAEEIARSLASLLAGAGGGDDGGSLDLTSQKAAVAAAKTAVDTAIARAEKAASEAAGFKIDASGHLDTLRDNDGKDTGNEIEKAIKDIEAEVEKANEGSKKAREQLAVVLGADSFVLVNTEAEANSQVSDAEAAKTEAEKQAGIAEKAQVTAKTKLEAVEENVKRAFVGMANKAAKEVEGYVKGAEKVYREIEKFKNDAASEIAKIINVDKYKEEAKKKLENLGEADKKATEALGEIRKGKDEAVKSSNVVPSDVANAEKIAKNVKSSRDKVKQALDGLSKLSKAASRYKVIFDGALESSRSGDDEVFEKAKKLAKIAELVDNTKILYSETLEKLELASEKFKRAKMLDLAVEGLYKEVTSIENGRYNYVLAVKSNKDSFYKILKDAEGLLSKASENFKDAKIQLEAAEKEKEYNKLKILTDSVKKTSERVLIYITNIGEKIANANTVVKTLEKLKKKVEASVLVNESDFLLEKIILLREGIEVYAEGTDSAILEASRKIGELESYLEKKGVILNSNKEQIEKEIKSDKDSSKNEFKQFENNKSSMLLFLSVINKNSVYINSILSDSDELSVEVEKVAISAKNEYKKINESISKVEVFFEELFSLYEKIEALVSSVNTLDVVDFFKSITGLIDLNDDEEIRKLDDAISYMQMDLELLEGVFRSLAKDGNDRLDEYKEVQQKLDERYKVFNESLGKVKASFMKYVKGLSFESSFSKGVIENITEAFFRYVENGYDGNKAVDLKYSLSGDVASQLNNLFKNNVSFHFYTDDSNAYLKVNSNKISELKLFIRDLSKLNLNLMKFLGDFSLWTFFNENNFEKNVDSLESELLKKKVRTLVEQLRNDVSLHSNYNTGEFHNYLSSFKKNDMEDEGSLDEGDKTEDEGDKTEDEVDETGDEDNLEEESDETGDEVYIEKNKIEFFYREIYEKNLVYKGKLNFLKEYVENLVRDAELVYGAISKEKLLEFANVVIGRPENKSPDYSIYIEDNRINSISLQILNNRLGGGHLRISDDGTIYSNLSSDEFEIAVTRWFSGFYKVNLNLLAVLSDTELLDEVYDDSEFDLTISFNFFNDLRNEYLNYHTLNLTEFKADFLEKYFLAVKNGNYVEWKDALVNMSSIIPERYVEVENNGFGDTVKYVFFYPKSSFIENVKNIETMNVLSLVSLLVDLKKIDKNLFKEYHFQKNVKVFKYLSKMLGNAVKYSESEGVLRFGNIGEVKSWLKGLSTVDVELIKVISKAEDNGYLNLGGYNWFKNIFITNASFHSVGSADFDKIKDFFKGYLYWPYDVKADAGRLKEALASLYDGIKNSLFIITKASNLSKYIGALPTNTKIYGLLAEARSISDPEYKINVDKNNEKIRELFLYFSSLNKEFEEAEIANASEAFKLDKVELNRVYNLVFPNNP